MQVIENVDTDGQSVKGNVYLETDDDGDLAPDLKNSFLKDIEFNVRPVSSNSKDYLEVTCTEQQQFQYPSRNITVHFQVPATCGVDVKVRGDASIEVKDLEGGPFQMVANQGTCYLKNLKGSSLKALSSNGGIICQSQLLFEHGFLETKKKGNISVKKLQGKEFYLKTEHGDVNVGATYLLKAKLASESGCINLGDVHGFTEIHVEEGNISIGSTSGQLEAFTGRGSIDVNLSQHEDVKLNTKEGDITIKCLQESFSSEFLVKSNHIHVDSNINVVIDEERAEGNQTVMAGKLNKQDKEEEQIKMINAEAKLGTVNFEKEDWFTSLKLS